MSVKNGKPGVAVLAGGVSSEREVSLRSGKAVVSALKMMGYPVELVDVTSCDISELDRPFDVFFIALHGGFGEDGSLQKIMEERGLIYTGCDAASSEHCMDKVAAKQAFASVHLNTPPYVLIQGNASNGEIRSAARDISLPAVVKPRSEGSSVGVTIARNAESLRKGIKEAQRYCDTVLVEQYIDGRELHVAVLGCAALPIVEVLPSREFYDYEAKYGDSGTQYSTSVDLPHMVYDRVQDAGLSAFKALGCRDFARVDVMLSKNNRPFVLEVNTIPGFTEKSLLPMAAAAAGIAFPVLCDKIVQYALRRATVASG
ncbi:MAG: D-alanine--D-alanine ligase [Planctomycetota bacterium]